MQRASAHTYDRFKLIVTIILLLILLFMLLRGCATTAAPANPTEAPVPTQGTTSLPAAIENTSTPESTQTLLPSPSPVAATSTPTLAQPTATSASASATPAAVSTETPALATAEATATVLSTQQAPSGESAACNTISPSRLAVGQQARVLQRLNLRSDASITAPILQVSPTGTEVEVIGGPVCTPVGERAYLWWQIRLNDGTEGWSAEMPLNQGGYFLEPIS